MGRLIGERPCTGDRLNRASDDCGRSLSQKQVALNRFREKVSYCGERPGPRLRFNWCLPLLQPNKYSTTDAHRKHHMQTGE